MLKGKATNTKTMLHHMLLAIGINWRRKKIPIS